MQAWTTSWSLRNGNESDPFWLFGCRISRNDLTDQSRSHGCAEQGNERSPVPGDAGQDYGDGPGSLDLLIDLPGMP